MQGGGASSASHGLPYSPAIYNIGVHPEATPNPGGPVMHEFAYPSPSSTPSISSPHTTYLENDDAADTPSPSSTASSSTRDVDVGKWFRGGWLLYRENWRAFYGFQLFVFCIDFLLPLLYYSIAGPHYNLDDGQYHTMGNPSSPNTNTYAPGQQQHTYEYKEDTLQAHLSLISLFTWPLYMGHFFVGLTILRAKVYGGGYSALDDEVGGGRGQTDEAQVRVRFHDFLSGYYLYVPLLALTFVHGLLIALGLLCVVLPGLYLAVALTFVELIYIEYHHSLTSFDRYSDEPQPFSFWQAFTLSIERVNPHFLKVTVLGVLLTLLTIAGYATVIGTIFTVPFCCLVLVAAFEDLFGLRQDKLREYACVFSC